MLRVLALLVAFIGLSSNVAVAAQDKLVQACWATLAGRQDDPMSKYGVVATRKHREVTFTFPGGSNMVCYFVSETAEVPQLWKMTLSGYRQDENLVANSNLNIRTYFTRHK